MRRAKTALDNTFFFAAATYFEYFLGLVITTIIARTLGPEQYGIYSFVIWVAALGVALVSGGINTSIIRYLAELRGTGDLALIPWTLKLHFRILLWAIPWVILLLWVVTQQLESTTENSSLRLLLWMVFFAFIPKAVQGFYVGVAKGLEDFKVQLWINLLVNPINVLLVVAVTWLSGQLEAYVVVYTLIATLYGCIAWYLVGNQVSKTFSGANRSGDAVYRRSVLRSIKYLTLVLALGFLVEKQLEVFVLNYYGMPEIAGYYNAAFVLAVSAVTLIPGILNGVILPIMARTKKDGKEEQQHNFKTAARYLFLLAAPLIAFGVVFADRIIGLVLGADYYDAILPFQVILFFAGLTMVTGAANAVLLTHDLQNKMLLSNIVGAVINIMLAFVLIPFWHIWGALVAFAVTLLMISAANIGFASRQLNTTLDWLDFSKILVIAGVATVPIYLLVQDMPDILAIVLGGMLYLILFAVLILKSGCMTLEDRTIYQGLLDSFNIRTSRWLSYFGK